MIKNITIYAFLLVFGLGLLATKVSADVESMMGSVDEGHAESVEVIMQEILESQNVSTVGELDLSKISDDDWEHLGDAVMELYHPGRAHIIMDRMMGGEGSESLRQMHIDIGKDYLGYGDNSVGGYGKNYGGPGGMMGSSGMGYGSMMGYGAYGNYGILSTITWILAIAFLASGTYFFIRGARKK